MNHHHHPPPAPPATRPATSPNALFSTATVSECGNCGSRNRWVLHHVRLRDINRRLCTSCVLRLHPSSFCPSCFQFYDPASSPQPQPPNRLTCLKCSSITHSHCVSTPSPSDPLPHSSSYLCPPCSKPSFSFFDLDSKPTNPIDKKMALVLLCAAKIASASMGKAVIVARADAERKVREAAVSRKRAREALDHVAFVVAREKAKRKEASAEVSGSGNVGVKEKFENSCEGLAAANAKMGNAGTQRRELLNGYGAPNTSAKNGVPRAMEEVVRQKNVKVDCLQSNGNIDEKERPGELGQKQSEDGEPESAQKTTVGGGIVSSK